MIELELPPPWRDLAREWIPRLLAAWHAEDPAAGHADAGATGTEVPGGHLRWTAPPERPDLVDGAACFRFGPVTYACRWAPLVELVQGRPVAIGGQTVSFPAPWPAISGIPGGLLIRWETPGLVHGVLARLAGVSIREVRLYATSAVIAMTGTADRVLRFE